MAWRGGATCAGLHRRQLCVSSCHVWVGRLRKYLQQAPVSPLGRGDQSLLVWCLQHQVLWMSVTNHL